MTTADTVGMFTRTEQTRKGFFGFLYNKKNATAFKEGQVTPRRCRHCGAPFEATGRGAYLCAGSPSCDEVVYEDEETSHP